MKAIHNNERLAVYEDFTVFIPTKIQNESNSQHFERIKENIFYCIYPYKDTK